MTITLPIGLVLFMMFCLGALVGVIFGTLATLFSIRR